MSTYPQFISTIILSRRKKRRKVRRQEGGQEEIVLLVDWFTKKIEFLSHSGRIAEMLMARRRRNLHKQQCGYFTIYEYAS